MASENALQDDNDEENENQNQNDHYQHFERRAFSQTSFKNVNNPYQPQKQEIPSYSKSKNNGEFMHGFIGKDDTSGRGFMTKNNYSCMKNPYGYGPLSQQSPQMNDNNQVSSKNLKKLKI